MKKAGANRNVTFHPSVTDQICHSNNKRSIEESIEIMASVGDPLEERLLYKNPLDNLAAQLCMISGIALSSRTSALSNGACYRYRDHAEATSVSIPEYLDSDPNLDSYSTPKDKDINSSSESGLYVANECIARAEYRRENQKPSSIAQDASQVVREQYDNDYDYVTTDTRKGLKLWPRPHNRVQILKPGQRRTSSLWTLPEETDSMVAAMTPQPSPKRFKLSLTPKDSYSLKTDSSKPRETRDKKHWGFARYRKSGRNVNSAGQKSQSFVNSCRKFSFFGAPKTGDCSPGKLEGEGSETKSLPSNLNFQAICDPGAVSSTLGSAHQIDSCQFAFGKNSHNFTVKQNLQIFSVEQNLQQFSMKQNVKEFSVGHNLQGFTAGQNFEFAAGQSYHGFAGQTLSKHPVKQSPDSAVCTDISDLPYRSSSQDQLLVGPRSESSSSLAISPSSHSGVGVTQSSRLLDTLEQFLTQFSTAEEATVCVGNNISSDLSTLNSNVSNEVVLNSYLIQDDIVMGSPGSKVFDHDPSPVSPVLEPSPDSRSRNTTTSNDFKKSVYAWEDNRDYVLSSDDIRGPVYSSGDIRVFMYPSDVTRDPLQGFDRTRNCVYTCTSNAEIKNRFHDYDNSSSLAEISHIPGSGLKPATLSGNQKPKSQFDNVDKCVRFLHELSANLSPDDLTPSEEPLGGSGLCLGSRKRDLSGNDSKDELGKNEGKSVVVQCENESTLRTERCLKKPRSKRKKGKRIMRFLSRLSCISESLSSPRVSPDRLEDHSESSSRKEASQTAQPRISNPILISSTSFHHHDVLNQNLHRSTDCCSTPTSSHHSLDSMRSSADSAYSSVNGSAAGTLNSPRSEHASSDSAHQPSPDSCKRADILIFPDLSFSSIAGGPDFNSSLRITRTVDKAENSSIVNSATSDAGGHSRYDALTTLSDILEQLAVCEHDIDSVLLSQWGQK